MCDLGRQKSITSGIEAMHRSRTLGDAMVSCRGTWGQDGTIDPISLRIADLSQTASKSGILFLATTRLRWSELAGLDLQLYIERQLHTVKPSKHGRPRVILPRPHGNPALWQTVHVDAPICNIAVRTLTRDIQRCLSLVSVPQIGTAHTGTHIFRHLWASWRFSLGDSIEIIAEGLGHWSTSSTTSYIHPQLVRKYHELTKGV